MTAHDGDLLLKEFRAQINFAKTHIFKMQDIAEQLDDQELKRGAGEVRNWVEAADRRASSLQYDLRERARAAGEATPR